MLHTWGSLRSWTLSGHFHETEGHILIHVLEALSGLPLDVKFLSFSDIVNGALKDFDIIINAGEAGSAWSGGECWKDEAVLTALTEWAYSGGVFAGIGEPSAVEGYAEYLRMACVLGVDIDNGGKACHGRWAFTQEEIPGLWPEGFAPPFRKGVMLTNGNARVLMSENNTPTATVHAFGSGAGLYLSGFAFAAGAARALLNVLLFAATGNTEAEGVSDNPHVEFALFPHKLVFINNSDTPQ